MKYSIWCEIENIAVEPGQKHPFKLLVSDASGKPASGVTLKLRAETAKAIQIPPTVKTDKKGVASFEVSAGRNCGKVGVTASAGSATWKGSVHVTKVHVVHPTLDLTSTQLTLLKILYADKSEVHVLRAFGGGQSDNAVLQVSPRDTARNPTEVVKIGSRDAMSDEGSRYEAISKLVSRASEVRGPVTTGLHGAIVYSDANSMGGIEQVLSFEEFFEKRETDEIIPALVSVLKYGMGSTYNHCHVEPVTYRQLVDKFLPEQMVVSLGDKSAGIFPAGKAPKRNLNVRRFSTEQIENFRNSTAKITEGELILLEHFRISKVQEDDLNLEDGQQRCYKIKVRFGGGTVRGFRAGDHVDVLAKFVIDRQSRMAFGINDCLTRHGAKVGDKHINLDGEIYPDPQALFETISTEQTDAAFAIIHGDLHWDNVMLGAADNWWLIDYGLTGEGPVLFDFVKLETYLRLKVLSKANGDDGKALTPKQVLTFERALVENPIGRLKDTGDPLPRVLQKAAEVIRCIRRLARRYFVESYSEYLRFLFCYSQALSKYYPAKEKWAFADKAQKAKKTCEKNARQLFFALAPALAIGRLLEWQRIAKPEKRDDSSLDRPKQLDFVDMGSVLTPTPCKVALDVGNKCEPGVIDHHFENAGYHSATEAAWKKSDLYLNHIKNIPSGQVTWVTHAKPDFDSVASTYLAWHRHTLGYFLPGAEQLAAYASKVDRGVDFLEKVAFPDRTPYALFELCLLAIERRDFALNAIKQTSADMLHRGFKVLDYLCNLEAMGIHSFSSNEVPHEHGFWKATARLDEEVFDQYDFQKERVFKVRISSGGKTIECNALVLDHPRSVLFKGWARRKGYPVLIVRWPQREKPDHRIVISVPPDMDEALKGFGVMLEKQFESPIRKKLGKERPSQPIRWKDVDNSDPWYDGRGHNYTIVDSPRDGTILSLEQVVEALKSGKWVCSELTAQ